MNRLIIFLLFNSPLFLSAQINLVPNGDFEESYIIPSDITKTLSPKILPYWELDKVTGTWDVYSTKAIGAANAVMNFMGSQQPHSGNSYAGIIVNEHVFKKVKDSIYYSPKNDSIFNYSEYIQTKLTSTLIKGHHYLVSYFISLADRSDYGISGVDVLFSSHKMGRNELLRARPQIEFSNSSPVINSVDWMRLSGVFIATGCEKYLTLGKFHSISKMNYAIVQRRKGFENGGFTTQNDFMSYYFIDDVSVFDLDNLPQLNSSKFTDSTSFHALISELIVNVKDSIKLNNSTKFIMIIDSLSLDSTESIKFQFEDFLLKSEYMSFYDSTYLLNKDALITPPIRIPQNQRVRWLIIK